MSGDARVTAGGAPHPYIGAPVRRREDARLVTGRSRFVADLDVPDALHAAVVRSPHAHARIVGIDAGAARRLDGVVAIVTAADVAEIHPSRIVEMIRGLPEDLGDRQRNVGERCGRQPV